MQLSFEYGFPNGCQIRGCQGSKIFANGWEEGTALPCPYRDRSMQWLLKWLSEICGGFRDRAQWQPWRISSFVFNLFNRHI